MINKLIKKYNNKTISNFELLQLRHVSDYVSLKTIQQNQDFRIVLVQLVNDNYFIVKVTN